MGHMGNMRARTFFGLIALMLCASVGLQATQSAASLNDARRWERDLLEGFSADEPGWKWIPAVQSRYIPTVPSQKKVLVGVWTRATELISRDSLSISVYQ